MTDQTLRSLAEFPARLAQHFAAFPSAYRHWAPSSWAGVPSEPLTALEQLCHVRDVEIDGYQSRFRRTLSEANPALRSLDTVGLAQSRNYAAADADAVLAQFRAARAVTVALLTNLTPVQLERRAQFEDFGPSSLRSLIHYLCSHDQQHLAGLQWLLGKIEAQR